MATKNTTTTTVNTARKTTCPVSRQAFRDNGAAASPVVTIAGQGVVATPREFSTGSVGYYANGKVQLMIGGVPTMCQVGVTITVIGSKELPELPRAISPEVAAIMAASKAKAAEVAAAVA